MVSFMYAESYEYYFRLYRNTDGNFTLNKYSIYGSNVVAFATISYGISNYVFHNETQRFIIFLIHPIGVLFKNIVLIYSLDLTP